MPRNNRNPDMPTSRIAQKGAAIDADVRKREETAQSDLKTVRPVDHDHDGTREDARQNSAAAHAAGRVRRTQTVRDPGASYGLRPGWQRFTVVMRSSYVEALKAQAATEGRTIKAIIDEIMERYLGSSQ